LEKTTQAEAIAWIDSGAELFRLQKPAALLKHLVSCFMLVDGESILLLDHVGS
jgi:hypothetical protein